MARSVKPPV